MKIVKTDEAFMQNAQQVINEIEQLLNGIHTGELALATSYVRLGSKLLAVKENKYWVALNFKNFGEYIASVKDKIHVGRTQLYLYIATVEKLLPSVSEEDLDTMGITKALELKRLVSQTGQQPPQELVDLALNPGTTKEVLKGEVYKILHLPEDTKGVYQDFGGCYLTPEEKEEVKMAFSAAEQVDPPIPRDWDVHQRRKEIMLRLCREFLSSYAELSVDGKGAIDDLF